MSDRSKIKIVCNQWDIDTKEEYDKFARELRSNSEITFSGEEIRNGYTRFTIEGSKDALSKINEISEMIRFRRVKLTLTIENKRDSHILNNLDYVGRLGRTFISKHLRIGEEIGSFQRVFASPENDDRRFIVIYPYYTKTLQPIFETPEKVAELQFYANINKWRGYVPLPADPLTGFSVYSMTKKGLSVDIDQIVEKDGIFMINPKNMKRVDELITSIEYQNQTYSQQGYFSVNTSDMIPSDLDIMDEVVEMWGGENPATYSNTKIYFIPREVFHDDTFPDFNLELCDWMRRSVGIIKEGKLPIVRVTGPWMLWSQRSEGSEDGDPRERSRQLKMRMSYIAMRAYDKTAVNNKQYLFETHSVHVRDDLSINATLACRDDYNLFARNVNELLNILPEIIAVPVENKEYAAALIWYIQEEKMKYRPLGFSLHEDYNCSESSDRVYVVVSRELADKVSSFMNDRERILEELKKKFVEFFSDCHESKDIVTDTEIESMSLEQLVDLGVIVQGGTGIKYCYLSETLKSLKRKVDPVSRRIIPVSTLKRIVNEKFFSDDVIGLVSAGPIRGFDDSYIKENEFTRQHLVKPPKDVLTFHRIYESNLEAENILVERIIGASIRVNINYPDGKTFPLVVFSDEVDDTAQKSISPPKNTKKFSNQIQNVWACGYFLNSWAKAYHSVSGKMSKYPVIHSDMMMNAAGSIDDGKIFMDFLSQIETEVCGIVSE